MVRAVPEHFENRPTSGCRILQGPRCGRPIRGQYVAHPSTAWRVYPSSLFFATISSMGISY